MFGIVDIDTYEIRAFFVNNDRQKETLLPIVKKIYILSVKRFMIIKILMIWWLPLESIQIDGKVIKWWILMKFDLYFIK